MPPATLLLDCDAPTLQGDTWRDVALLAARQKAALSRCQLDKTLLREWSAAQ